MQNFRITHNNGQVDIVAAERYRADGSWIIFEDSDKHEVHRISERDARSIARDDAREVPGPMSA
jgi:hypothetical protein